MYVGQKPSHSKKALGWIPFGSQCVLPVSYNFDSEILNYEFSGQANGKVQLIKP